MSSQSRRIKNRVNAKKSTGPRSHKGKRVSSQNATKHGLLSAGVILPGVETESEWKAHQEAVIRDLAPEGAMQRDLAERIADLAWRLKRCSLSQGRLFPAILERHGSGSTEDSSPESSHDLDTRIAKAWDKIASQQPSTVNDLEAVEALMKRTLGSSAWLHQRKFYRARQLWPPTSYKAVAKCLELSISLSGMDPAIEIPDLLAQAMEKAEASERGVDSTKKKVHPGSAEFMAVFDTFYTETLPRIESNLERRYLKLLHEYREQQRWQQDTLSQSSKATTTKGKVIEAELSDR